MRAVQQSMTMAMAVNMASSSSGFPSPVGNAPPISSQNHVGQFVSSNHPSRYPQGQHPSGSNSNGTSSIGNIRQHRKRRANSNAIEGYVTYHFSVLIRGNEFIKIFWYAIIHLIRNNVLGM